MAFSPIEHLGKHPKRVIGLIRRASKTVVQHLDLGTCHVGDPLTPQGRQNDLVEDSAILFPRPRLGFILDVFGEKTFGEFRHGRSGFSMGSVVGRINSVGDHP